MRFTLLIIGAVLVTTQAFTEDKDPPRAAVIVELFTSEGCSSCPPADKLLERLDSEQPVPGARIIVLSEHVDYWNHIGWTDPYSSSAFSRRQEGYASRFGLDGVYTPQMVVDGRTQFVGSDWAQARSAIQNATGFEKATVRISVIPGGVRVEADALPASAGKSAGVFLARAVDNAVSNVSSGENKGRQLRHVAIAKEIERIGAVTSTRSFAKDIQLGNLSGMRLVAFVQANSNGPILGSAALVEAPHSEH